MMNQIFSLESLASALGGAGLAMLATDMNRALILLAAGVALHVLKAVLNAKGIPIGGRKSK